MINYLTLVYVVLYQVPGQHSSYPGGDVSRTESGVKAFWVIDQRLPSRLQMKSWSKQKPKSPDDRIAASFWQSELAGSSVSFALAIRNSSLQPLKEQTLESVAFAATRYAKKDDFIPAYRCMHLRWDGASAELISEAWELCVKRRLKEFATNWSLLSPPRQRNVLDIVSVAFENADVKRLRAKQGTPKGPVKVFLDRLHAQCK